MLCRSPAFIKDHHLFAYAITAIQHCNYNTYTLHYIHSYLRIIIMHGLLLEILYIVYTELLYIFYATLLYIEYTELLYIVYAAL